MICKAALYIRLSKDDGRGESAGIESQRLILRTFAESNGIEIAGEYVDDGYSGTKTQRPAFLKMLRDVEDGKINTVIVKDMSRLGRDYISTGELTEVYFPEHFVRFISINDGYDSERGMDDMTPFRHVMNEMYARDISRKIRSALYAKMRDGQYVGSFPPYGYKKSEADKNKLEIDDEAAENVRMIFELKGRGESTKNIVEKLNKMGTLIPLEYRKKRENREYMSKKWTESGVCKILRNQVYIGNTVQGKSFKPSIKSKRSYSRARDNWIVVKNTHQPIVSEELFYKINNINNNK